MLALIAILATLSACPPAGLPLTVAVNRSEREVVLTTAPIDLPAAEGHEGDHGYHEHGVVTPLTPFAWPVGGWGFELDLAVFARGGFLPDRLP